MIYILSKYASGEHFQNKKSESPPITETGASIEAPVSVMSVSYRIIKHNRREPTTLKPVTSKVVAITSVTSIDAS